MLTKVVHAPFCRTHGSYAHPCKNRVGKGQGWFVGYNSNIKGHDGRHNRYPAYQGGGARFAKLFREAMADNFRGLDMK